MSHERIHSTIEANLNSIERISVFLCNNLFENREVDKSLFCCFQLEWVIFLVHKLQIFIARNVMILTYEKQKHFIEIHSFRYRFCFRFDEFMRRCC